ncbi:MAG: helix-hairpin-helix domain-containing protein [candidate division NC10 bacterium]
MTRSMILLAASLVAILLSRVPLVSAGQAADSHGGSHGAPMHGQHMGELDINMASVEELRQLPGINEASAKKIVQNRPYTRKDELVTKKVLPQTAYDAIREHIVAAPVVGAKPSRP